MVTIKDIAAEAGVSFSAVAKIMKGQGSFKPETIERIKATAKEMGYFPNTFAETMRTGKTFNIGLLLSRVYSLGTDQLPKGSSNLQRYIMSGLTEALLDTNYFLSVEVLPEQRRILADDGPKFLQKKILDGLIINYHADNPAVLEELEKNIKAQKLPAIWLNRKRDCDCVYQDDEKAAYLATRHLIEKGSRVVLLINTPSGSNKHYSVKDIENGYLKAMREFNLTPSTHELAYNNPSIKRGVTEGYDFLKDIKPGTGMVTYSEGHAKMVLAAAEKFHGLRVPEDLEISTFFTQNQIELDQIIVDPISGLVAPQFELGKAIVETVLQKIANPEAKLPPRILPYHRDFKIFKQAWII